MSKIWMLFVVSAGLSLIFYPIIFAVENNAAECIFAKDIMTCVQIKNK
jgi:hypothetical protein